MIVGGRPQRGPPAARSTTRGRVGQRGARSRITAPTSSTPDARPAPTLIQPRNCTPKGSGDGDRSSPAELAQDWNDVSHCGQKLAPTGRMACHVVHRGRRTSTRPADLRHHPTRLAPHLPHGPPIRSRAHLRGPEGRRPQPADRQRDAARDGRPMARRVGPGGDRPRLPKDGAYWQAGWDWIAEERAARQPLPLTT